ncbi:hypothetical protein BJY52DRAFT_1225799 [Lactarius psammicola]|nr:hypothetical protein BJY52DRAFT_1225799 [Lactarius psammicola]
MSGAPQSLPTLPQGPPTHEVNVTTFAFRIDVLLLSLFALYVVSTLPRALVRLFQPSDVFNGFFLRSGSKRAPAGWSNSTSTLLRANTLDSSESKGKANAASPVHHSTGVRMALGEDSRVTDPFPALVVPVANRRSSARQPYAPTRIPRWTTVVHPSLAYTLNFRVSSGFSLGQLLVLIAYGLIFLYACLYRSNPLKDPIRTAYIAVSQIPIIVALANKSNWLSWLKQLNYVHRFSGRIVIIAANVHALGHIYKASFNGNLLAALHIPLIFWGLTCSLADKMYSLFFVTHVVCVVVSLVAVYMHQPSVLPYILTAVALYAFDHIVRIARTQYTRAWLTAENALNGGTTLVDVPSLSAGWRAGQHPGARGRASCLRTATAGDATEKSADAERGREPAREVRIIVEGGPGYTHYTAYSGVVLVAGGSGISYVTGVLDDILQKHASGKSNVRVIEVVWSVTDPDSLYSLLPELSPLMQPRASPCAALSLRFSVHWTRKSARAPQVPRTALPPGMYLHAGRPNLSTTLQSVISSVGEAYTTTTTCCRCNPDSPSGIVVGSCGPTSLIDDAARAVGGVSWADWIDVGGVESIEEVFGW